MKWFLLTFLVLLMPLAAAEIKVLAFAGSTRADSYNRKLIKEAVDIARQKGAKVTLIDLKDFAMPFYDGDLETSEGLPPNAKRLRDLMMGSDAIMIATPEYNGSVSAVLKNALDWASRNEQGQGSRDAYKGKRFAIMSASPGGGGGGRALATLKGVIENVGGEVVAKQVAVGNADKAFDANGKLTNPQLKQDLSDEIQQMLR